jgi:uncharacterized protein (TIGR00296 family)
MFDIKQGSKLVMLARSAVERSMKSEKSFYEKVEDPDLKKEDGVFVTILTFPERELRGCVGFPTGSGPLCESVQSAARSSAFEDTRFRRMDAKELKNVIFEVSVLSKPESIQMKGQKDYLSKIEIGKDGLILQNGPFYGLLLPQVPVEFGWDVGEFLKNLCYKAGLTPDWIEDDDTRLWKFQSQIFEEKEPGGEVVEIKLAKHSE